MFYFSWKYWWFFKVFSLHMVQFLLYIVCLFKILHVYNFILSKFSLFSFLFLLLSLLGFFIYFFCPFVIIFVFVFLFFMFFSYFSSLLGFVELGSIMGKLSYYYQYWNSIFWCLTLTSTHYREIMESMGMLWYVVNIPPTNTLLLRYLNMLKTIVVVVAQTTPKFFLGIIFSFYLRPGFLFFIFNYLLLCLQINHQVISQIF